MKCEPRAASITLLLLVMAIPASSPADLVTIAYETSDLGANRWQYTYTVENVALTEYVEEFTIWFQFGLFDSLAMETPDPPASEWDELVIQPDPVLTDDGFYDALTLTDGIGIGESVEGFAVSFDWLGSGEPGSQPFEIIDPVTFETLYEGNTVPEPMTFLMAGTILLFYRWRGRT